LEYVIIPARTWGIWVWNARYDGIVECRVLKMGAEGWGWRLAIK
jgi:hypothetical protein